MDSCSENSFAWTDTSSDSIMSASMAGDNENSDENKYVDHRKKKKDKKLSRTKENVNSIKFESEVDIKEEKTYCENISHSIDKKKNIKLEPDSENERSKTKKKLRKMESNGNLNESTSYDETYLNMKVKQEGASSSSKHKQKKQKQTSSIDSKTSKSKIHDNSHNNSSSEAYHDNVPLKKKKKKSKKQFDSDNDNINEDKMNIEETVVNKQEKTLIKHNHPDASAAQNNTLQEESEESGYDEISAIKCDDSHSLHTISFINKSIENENTEINHNNSLNIFSELHSKTKPELDSNDKSVKINHRTQRISDRIRFEDDDDDTYIESSHLEDGIIQDYSKKYKKALKLKQFLKVNTNLKLVTQTFNNNQNLTQDDEIWILKCPKEININDFNNTTLNIYGKCKIKIGGQTYEGSAEEPSGTISLLTMEHSNSKIRNVPLSGIINLHKRIPKAHYRDDNIMVNNQTNFIPLPETKCRHPLFGSNYKKNLKIPAAIAERLYVQNCEKSMSRTEKKKNKKDKSSSEHICQPQESEMMLKLEPENSVEKLEKKKKKRKIMGDEGPVPKKIKRVKHDPESAEAWESEKAIEENLFNF